MGWIQLIMLVIKILWELYGMLNNGQLQHDPEAREKLNILKSRLRIARRRRDKAEVKKILDELLDIKDGD